MKPNLGAEGPKQTVPNQAARPSGSSSNPHNVLGVEPSQNYVSSTTTGANTAWVSNQESYRYPLWANLSQRERDLYTDIAKSYHSQSTGKSWYEKQFVPYAMTYLRQTGIAIDPEYAAIRFAQESNYDVRDFFASSPSISPNSILFGEPPGGYEGATSSSGSGSGSYGGDGGYGGGGGGGQVSLTNPTSARGLLLQTMQNVLGRNPTDNEYKTFLQVLNEAEMANPQTVSVEGDTVVGSGGTDPGVLALEFAQDQEDYKERQGDMYFETFMRALAGGA